MFHDDREAHARGLAGKLVQVGFFAAQSFSFERPPYVGERVFGRTELVDVYEKKRSDGTPLVFAELETATGTDGEHVLTGSHTRVEVRELWRSPSNPSGGEIGNPPAQLLCCAR